MDKTIIIFIVISETIMFLLCMFFYVTNGNNILEPILLFVVSQLFIMIFTAELSSDIEFDKIFYEIKKRKKEPIKLNGKKMELKEIMKDE